MKVCGATAEVLDPNKTIDYITNIVVQIKVPIRVQYSIVAKSHGLGVRLMEN